MTHPDKPTAARELAEAVDAIIATLVETLGREAMCRTVEHMQNICDCAYIEDEINKVRAKVRAALEGGDDADA